MQKLYNLSYIAVHKFIKKLSKSPSVNAMYSFSGCTQ